MEIGKLITYYTNEANITLKDVAKLSGVPLDTIYNITSGRTKFPRLSTVKKIAKTLDIPLDDLAVQQPRVPNLSPQGLSVGKSFDRLDEHGKNIILAVLHEENIRLRNKNSTAEIVWLPYAAQPASAGYGEYIDDNNAEQIAVKLNKQTLMADYILRVNGDSMSPRINDGQRVLVRTQPTVEIGEIGIFFKDGEQFIKVYRGDHLESINPKYPDIQCVDDMKCCGKVIAPLDQDWE